MLSGAVNGRYGLKKINAKWSNYINSYSICYSSSRSCCLLIELMVQVKESFLIDVEMMINMN